MGTTIRPVLWATLSVWLLAGSVGGLVTAGDADVSDLRGTSRVAGKPAANAVVWLDAPDAPRTTPSTIVLEQRNMAFSPRVLAAQVGTVVELPNYDRVFHNVFSFTDGKPFDLGLYPTGATKRITLDRPALSL